MAKAQRYTLWGWRTDGAYGPAPIKLTGGAIRTCRAEYRDRQAEGVAPWLLAIYAEGMSPAGLRLQVEQYQS